MDKLGTHPFSARLSSCVRYAVAHCVFPRKTSELTCKYPKKPPRMISFAQLVGGALLVYISLGILACLCSIWSTRAAYRPQISPIPPPPPRFFFVYAENPDEAVGSPPALPSNFQWPREFGESAGTIDFCAVCGQPAELTCSRCRSVFYCSRKHKKQVR